MSRRSKKRRQHDLDDLRARIEQAFSSIPYPGDDKLVSGRADTDVDTHLRGKHWQDIAPGARRGSHWMKKHSDLLQGRVDFPLFFLTPEAYIFYLPAYLIACLDYDSYYEVADKAILTLSPLVLPDTSIIEIMDRLDREQKRVIRDVLIYLREYGTYVTDELESAIALMEQIGEEG